LRSLLIVATPYQKLYGQSCYGVATIGRLLKIIGLFCKKSPIKGLYSAKETYDFKEPTTCGHPILQHTAPHSNKHCTTLHHTLQHTATHGNTLPAAISCCSMLQRVAGCCSVLQHAATHSFLIYHSYLVVKYAKQK